MIAINIRGTGGSGKSTLAKNVMALYPKHANILEAGRKKPMSTVHWFEDARKLDGSGLYSERPPGLMVPGHYETACGGCDTVKTVDKVYELVRATTLGDGNNALYEGIMVMDDVTRAVKFSQDLEKAGGKLVVISLTTSIEECLSSIRARRAAGGNEKPLNEKNTRDRMKRQESSLHRLKQAGVNLMKLNREEALLACRELLGLM